MKPKKRNAWKRVIAPGPWRAKPGDELVGTYLGPKTRSGMYGDYICHYVEQTEGRKKKIFYVSGTTINDLFALINVDSLIRLVFTGMKVAKHTGNEYKTFELYTEDSVEFRVFDEEEEAA